MQFHQVTESGSFNTVYEAETPGGRFAKVSVCMNRWTWEILSAAGYVLAAGRACCREEAEERAMERVSTW